MLAIGGWKCNLILVLVLTIVNPCWLDAQSGTSSAISGTVTDASGAVVADASITATETNTKAVRDWENRCDRTLPVFAGESWHLPDHSKCSRLRCRGF